MAIVALVAGQDMIGTFADRIHAVVTGNAVADEGNVVHERHRGPGRRRVAIITLVR